MEKLKHWNYNNENNDAKYLNKMQETWFLKVKNSLLELEKYFIEMKDREIKDRKLKIERKIRELFLQPINVSVDYRKIK